MKNLIKYGSILTIIILLLSCITISVTAKTEKKHEKPLNSPIITDDFYTISEPTYAWIDGVTGGTEVTFDDDDDGSSIEIPLGIDFDFYGGPRTSFWINTNGMITFDGPSDEWDNSPIPDTDQPNNFLPVYWDDLALVSNSAVYYKVDTLSTPKKVIVTWKDISQCCDPAHGIFTFEAVLYEDGRILYQYKEPSLLSYPGEETIGVEDVGGSRGTQYKYYEPVDDFSAVMFTYIPEKRFIFVRGTDGALWYREFDRASWGDWTCLGGIITTDPDATTLEGRTYVFARGTDNALWYRVYDDSWSEWANLGGILDSGPGAS